jgi:hypothetical protein
MNRIIPVTNVADHEEIFLSWVKWVLLDQDGDPIGGYRTQAAAEKASEVHFH